MNNYQFYTIRDTINLLIMFIIMMLCGIIFLYYYYKYSGFIILLISILFLTTGIKRLKQSFLSIKAMEAYINNTKNFQEFKKSLIPCNKFYRACICDYHYRRNAFNKICKRKNIRLLENLKIKIHEIPKCHTNYIINELKASQSINKYNWNDKSK